MRILYITRRSWPAVGGIETLLRHISQGIARNHHVELVALRIDQGPGSRVSDGPRLPAPFEPFDDAGVRVSPLCLSSVQRLGLTPLLLQNLPIAGRYAFGRARLVLAALYSHIVAPQLVEAAFRADVVHIWTDGFPAAAGLLAARRAGRPVVITPFMHRGQWGDDYASVATYRRADRVAALLEPEAEHYGELGVSPERIGVSGACTPGVAAADGTVVRNRFGIKGPLVLFLGARSEAKGYHLLRQAAALVPPSANLTIGFVGLGAPLESFRATPGARVIEVGQVSDQERAEWLHAADLVCLPSAGETFGMVVLEAWSAGKPVLTSDIPPLRRLVELSGGGRAVPRDVASIANALMALAADPTQRVSMGAAGRRYWQENFTVERVCDWHVALYEELVGQEGIPILSNDAGQRKDRRLGRS
jgi:glycosyltransferase involved in cell wall biosynthesis